MKVNIKKDDKIGYILSASAYKPVGMGSDSNHRDPKEIIKELGILEREVACQNKLIQKLINDG